MTGDGDGLPVGLAAGLTRATDAAAVALMVGAAVPLGSVEDEGVAAGVHPDNATTTVTNIAVTGVRIWRLSSSHDVSRAGRSRG